jgi:hypothetical protein
MNKIMFSSIYDHAGQPCVTSDHTTDAETLPEILKSFEHFLRGAGFIFDGDVQIVEEGEAVVDDPDTDLEYVLHLEDELAEAYALLDRVQRKERQFFESTDSKLSGDIKTFLFADGGA